MADKPCRMCEVLLLLTPLQSCLPVDTLGKGQEEMGLRGLFRFTDIIIKDDEDPSLLLTIIHTPVFLASLLSIASTRHSHNRLQTAICFLSFSSNSYVALIISFGHAQIGTLSSKSTSHSSFSIKFTTSIICETLLETCTVCQINCYDVNNGKDI